MSTITKEFTKEQLQQIEAAAKEVMWPVVWSEKKAREHFSEKITPKVVLKLARIALASLEAEPVAWLLSGGGAKNNVSFDSGNAYADPLREVTPLYTAPPAPEFYKIGDATMRHIFTPTGITDVSDMQAVFDQIETVLAGMWQPAPVSVPDAMEMDDDFDSAFEHGKAVGWNAYRAAMLQGADGNSPVIPDGWVACVERMPSAGEQVLAYRPDAPESNDPLIKMATYVGGSAHGHGFDCYCKPTHWMPLPAAPQQEA